MQLFGDLRADVGDQGERVALSSEVGVTSADEFEKVRLAGVVRDGISEVTVKFEDGREMVVPVRDNAFWVDVTGVGVPTSVAWNDGHGSHRVPTYVESPKATIDRYESGR